MSDGEAVMENPNERGGNTAHVTAPPARFGRRPIRVIIQGPKSSGLTGQECPIRKKILALLEAECSNCRYNFTQK